VKQRGVNAERGAHKGLSGKTTDPIEIGGWIDETRALQKDGCGGGKGRGQSWPKKRKAEESIRSGLRGGQAKGA